MWEKSSADRAVRGGKHPTNRSGESMYRSQAGIRERQTPKQAGKGHILAGIAIAPLFVSPLKRSSAPADALDA
jgi:hypothetical protein